jgi:hypothetical protein
MSFEKSIRTKLQNIARKENIAFQIIIIRYLHERLLYRISVSLYHDFFFLKGGNFLYAIKGFYARPTKDIDFLGVQIENSIDTIKMMFYEICHIKYRSKMWQAFLKKIKTDEQLTFKEVMKMITFTLKPYWDDLR